MESFNDLFKTACNIKSTYLNQDKKQFNSQPEFFQSGLYNYESVKNIHNQNFQIKKFSYEVLRTKGLFLVKTRNFEEANYTFSKALSIFKYIKCSNPNWKKGGGIKDEELSYFEDQGNSVEEKNEINQMIIQCLLNISYCEIESERFVETRQACDEVIKRDKNNIKAYYRISKSYYLSKSSGYDEYLIAYNTLEKCREIDSSVTEINSLYDKLKHEIERHKSDEKKIFKSFFRKVNEKYAEEKEKEEEEIVKIRSKEGVGKPQMSFLNLIIDNCNLLIPKYKDVKGKEKELKEIENSLNTALYYKNTLESLIDIDFKNPNQMMIDFSKENNVNLDDENVQKEFLKVRDDFIGKVNELYEKNFGDISKMNENSKYSMNMKSGNDKNLLKRPKEGKEDKEIKENNIKEGNFNLNKKLNSQINYQKEDNSKKMTSNQSAFGDELKNSDLSKANEKKKVSAKDIQSKIKSRDYKKNNSSVSYNGIPLSLSGIIVLSVLLIYYIIVDYLVPYYKEDENIYN